MGCIDVLSDIKCFIVDMDGTFYLGDALLPGAKEFADCVEKSGKRFFFFTNNSSHNEEECLGKLRKYGYDAKEGNVIISSHVTIDFLLRNRPGKKVYLLGNENLTGDFIKAGVPLTETEPDIVVLGFDTTLTYEKINKAANFLAAGAEYIATHPDNNCPLKDGFMPDTGSMIALFERSTGRTPELIMGKPYAFTVDYVTNKIGCKREEIAFVGDRLETDIAIGVKNGLKAVLVYTGVTTPAMYEKSDIKATVAFENIGELGKALI
ncbi:MAG: HAD-IIA family hydrolase [Ruminococcaceae bacterium]|nr:HAD-IIA family hydrolase [Oscillospiraceae bacterium]MBR3595946.1 HAD-IIA family hydrolase [Clostridia bacterium]